MRTLVLLAGIVFSLNAGSNDDLDKCPELGEKENFTTPMFNAINCLIKLSKHQSERIESLTNELEILKTEAELPVGTVVAINSSESVTCPGKNWKLFDAAKGRFILGAGHGDHSSLTPRQLGETGGEEKHTLSRNEMPDHNHGMNSALNGAPLSWGGGSHPVPTTPTPPSALFDWSGGNGRAHNNMPPYIALYFCEKVK